jgi:hypothetical protein
MIFGIVNDLAKIVEDGIDIGAALLTGGELGELNKQNVSRLIATGLTAAAVAEAFGVGVDVIENMID